MRGQRWCCLLAIFLNCFPPHFFFFWDRVPHCTRNLLFWQDYQVTKSLESVSLSLSCLWVTRVQSCLDFMWVLRSELGSSCLYSKLFIHWAPEALENCSLKTGVKSLLFCHGNLNSRRQEVSLGQLNWRRFDIWITLVSEKLELKFPLWCLLL